MSSLKPTFPAPCKQEASCKCLTLEPVCVLPQAGWAPPGGSGGSIWSIPPSRQSWLRQLSSRLTCICTSPCASGRPLLSFQDTSHWTEGPLELRDDLTGDLKLITPTKTLLLRKVTLTRALGGQGPRPVLGALHSNLLQPALGKTCSKEGCRPVDSPLP